MLRSLFPRLYEGWIVVGAAGLTVLIVASTFFYGFGTIFNEVLDEFGWSVAATALAFSLRSEVGGLASPFMGYLVDRFGARIVMVAGVVVASVGVLLMSYIQTIWHFYAAMIVIAIGTSAAGPQVGMSAVATWFERRRGRAMALTTVGGGLGGLLVVAVAWLVDLAGWRDALRIEALIMLTFGTLVVINIRTRPDDHPQPVDGLPVADEIGLNPGPSIRWGIPWRRVACTRSFLLLSVGLIALSFGTTSMVVHQIPYFEREIGMSKAEAGSTVALFTLVSIAGRLGFGFMADRYAKRLMMAVAAGMVVLGYAFVALAPSAPMAILGIVIMAPGFGGGVPVRPALLADYYGTRYFGTINGLAAAVMTGGALGPWTVGRLVDLTGSYDLGWMAAGLATALAVPLFLLSRMPEDLAHEYRSQVHAEITEVRVSVP